MKKKRPGFSKDKYQTGAEAAYVSVGAHGSRHFLVGVYLWARDGKVKSHPFSFPYSRLRCFAHEQGGGK